MMPSTRSITERRRYVNAPGLTTLALVLLAWEIAVRSGAVAFDYLPAPSAIAAAFVDLIVSGELVVDAAHTVLAALCGWIIALAIGTSAGLALGFSPAARRYSLASIELLRPLPGIAFVPPAILLFGLSWKTELLVIVFPVLWPILINTMGGVMAVPPRLHEVARTLRLPRRDIVCKVVVPASAPAIFVGARLGLTLALVMAIIAEMVGNPVGLGYAVVREGQAFQPERMFAYILFVGVLGIGLNAVLMEVGRWLLPRAAPAP
jgi:sulfonate transport system permease protein